MPRTEALVELVMDWLRDNGPGTAPRIARDIGRDAGLVNASLRKYEQTGRVQRAGQELNPLGRAATIYELVKQDNEEVPEVQTENGRTTLADMAAGSGEPEEEVTGEELAAAAAEVELKAADMDELLSAYCGGLTLAESASTTLLFVLRMRRVQDKLREVEAAG